MMKMINEWGNIEYKTDIEKTIMTDELAFGAPMLKMAE